MVERAGPHIYTIAAHRGFADALVAGLVPRYAEPDLGLARLTLLVPSSRAARTISEAFIRHAGASGQQGLLMPRMAVIGDLDLDEALGSLLDPLGASDIPPAAEAGRRWLELARLIELELADQGAEPLPARARLHLAREMARTMDRLLAERKTPDDLLGDAVLDRLGALAGHWQDAIRLFARVQARWLARLEETGEVDAATRRNLLFERAARGWRAAPPAHPVVAAGVTSAAPALAQLLRVIADLPNGAVILPDLDVDMSAEAWDELGRAGASPEPGGDIFTAQDALTHPQYHLKLLLGRMGIARAEVRKWHRRGIGAAEPARSHAISSLFLPPQASRSWVDLPADKRRLKGVRIMTTASIEEEAQAIALLVREALETPERRIAVVTANRTLARRVVQHLARWNIAADDSAGRALALTPAGRLMGLLAELMAGGLAPQVLVGALAHPLVQGHDPEARRRWLAGLRAFDRALRGPAPPAGTAPLRKIAAKAKIADWWAEAEGLLAPLLVSDAPIGLADALDRLAGVAESLAGEAAWAREDGRALASLIETIRMDARSLGTMIDPRDLAGILRDCMDEIAVRPPYGAHPRVAVLGLLEARMARADLVICGDMNEGSWPGAPATDALLAPGILRALGVPGAEFRIGLAAHDLAGAMGAPQVILSRALRDGDGPTLPSRFLLRVEALLGDDLAREHRESAILALAPRLDRLRPPAAEYPRPAPDPAPALRRVAISATALDRLLGDPYQFYAQAILGLRRLDPLGADPFSDPALRGILMHDILDAWHKARAANLQPERLAKFAQGYLAREQVHPLFRGLWQPRLLAALETFEEQIAEHEKAGRTTIATEIKGAMETGGITVHGRADRIDRLEDGTLVIIDYKTGAPPSAKQVEAGFALQLGVLGLIAREGSFTDEKTHQVITGDATGFEYWSFARVKGEEGFGYIDVPMKVKGKKTGVLPEDFLPHHEDKLSEAIARYINGKEPFTARENPDYRGYNDYDQLMRLEEWAIRLTEPEMQA
ncbi:MAG: PD-(D/E)XK nuclease family protein [Erythrobacter sp.]